MLNAYLKQFASQIQSTRFSHIVLSLHTISFDVGKPSMKLSKININHVNIKILYQYPLTTGGIKVCRAQCTFVVRDLRAEVDVG